MYRYYNDIILVTLKRYVINELLEVVTGQRGQCCVHLLFVIKWYDILKMNLC